MVADLLEAHQKAQHHVLVAYAFGVFPRIGQPRCQGFENLGGRQLNQGMGLS
jgi:hypothetical protein